MKNSSFRKWLPVLGCMCLWSQFTFSQTDQNLLYATYFGGNGEETGSSPNGIQTRADGSILIGAPTTSTDLNYFDNAFQTNFNALQDVYVALFNPDGDIAYSTYLGGSGIESFAGVAFTPEGGFVVAGNTPSSDFPVTPNAYQLTNAGESDGFITYFNADYEVVWSTYYGGGAFDRINDLVADNEGNVYIIGVTSSDGLGTPGVHQENLENPDINGAFGAKFDSDGLLIWMTYLSGDAGTAFRAVDISSDGTKLFCGGITGSSTGIAFNAFQENFAGGGFYSNGVLSCFNASDGTVIWSTYYGGNGDAQSAGDLINDVKASDNNSLLVAGYTESTINIASPDAYISQINGINDNFLTCFSQDGTRIWGTYFGGSEGELNNPSISVSENSVVLIGRSFSTDGISIGNALEPEFTHSAGAPSYFAKFNISSGEPIWSTYFLADRLAGTFSSIAHLNDGTFATFGFLTSANDDIITDDAFQSSHGGGEADWGLCIFEDNVLSTSDTRYKNLNVFPNPANSQVYIEIPNRIFTPIHLTIFDMSGRLASEKGTVTPGSAVDISGLAPGVYVVKGESQGEQFRQKLIISR